jgi:hypothetical protein
MSGSGINCSFDYCAPAVPAVALLLPILFLSGCLAHSRGIIVETQGLGPMLRTQEGQELRLVLLGEDAAALAHLDGAMVDVSGQRLFRNFRVDDWTVLSGSHGMATWVGPLRFLGSRVAIEDRGSGVTYVLDNDASKSLLDEVGSMVLLEGYVDGPHRIQVVFYDLLR